MDTFHSQQKRCVEEEHCCFEHSWSRNFQNPVKRKQRLIVAQPAGAHETEYAEGLTEADFKLADALSKGERRERDERERERERKRERKREIQTTSTSTTSPSRKSTTTKPTFGTFKQKLAFKFPAISGPVASRRRVKRNGVSRVAKLWPSAKIPYAISPHYSAHERALLARAVKAVRAF